MTVIDVLMRNLPLDSQIEGIYIGKKWVLSILKKPDGQLLAGVASAVKYATKFQAKESVADIIAQLNQEDPIAVSIALATINALLPQEQLSKHDAADWLSAQSQGRKIAIFGRFPFIEDEIRPFAKDVFVFEQEAQDGEYTADDMADILPQADIIAITGSAIVNHSIDSILAHVTKQQQVVILGPSTPLTSRLFDCGISAMFGVRVVNIAAAKASVSDGVGFQKMQGLERVALLK